VTAPTAMEPLPHRVHVVDDDPDVRRSLDRLLRGCGYDVRAYASTEEFLDALEPGTTGCLVADLQMPGGDGFALQDALAEKAPDLPLVFLTGHGDVGSGVRAMKAGAVDFLEKPPVPDALLAAVERAVERGLVRRRERAERTGAAERLALLTEREREVLDELLKGRLNKQIASTLGIVERTVKVHRARVMEKSGAKSLAELVRLADRAGGEFP
jgi:FixJ family two-component response regulator